MSEWRLFDGDTAHVSTFDFHEHRERAPHLEQAVHVGRLHLAMNFAVKALGWSQIHHQSVLEPALVDLGCGDGGLLSLIQDAAAKLVATRDLASLDTIGYDFQPSNAAGWAERGVYARSMDFVTGWSDVQWAQVYTITECLEHLTDPHEMLSRIWRRDAAVVASSPFTETYESHDACHAWAWDTEGYRAMVEAAGFRVLDHQTTGMFQVILGVPA